MKDAEMILRLKKIRKNYSGKDDEALTWAMECIRFKRPHGEWEKYGDKIEAFDIAGHKTWGQKRRCTNCGFIHTYIEDFGIYPFCPNCSALMYKEEGETE